MEMTSQYDVMVAQFVFLLLARAIFPGTSTEMDVKNGQCYCKKNKSTTIFHGLCSYGP